MDNRITKERLKNFFVYDFIKAFIICIIAGVLISLMFTTFGKQPTNGQYFYLMLADNVTISDDCKATGENMVSKLYEKYNFSYDMLEASSIQCQEAGTYSSSYLMTMYLSTNQCDVFLGFDDRDLEDEESDSLINIFLTSGYALEIYSSDNSENLIAKAKAYASKYLNIDGDSITIKEDLVREEFQAKYGKDSRFEKDNLYIQGLHDECDRILSIYNNACLLENVFINHPDLLVKYTVNEVEKNYCINLAKLNGKDEKLISNDIIYSQRTEEIDFDPYFAVCNNISNEGDAVYETITYICNFFNTYSTYLEEV